MASGHFPATYFKLKMLDLLDKLGLMGIPLFLCSFLIFVVSLEKSFFLLKVFFKKKEIMSSLKECIFQYKKKEKNIRDEAINLLLEKKRVSFLNRINFMYFISTISPMLGLVGTILGIIKTFKKISQNLGPVSPNLIADGLWEAMLTTALGLLISLFAVSIAYLLRHFAEFYLKYFCENLNELSLRFELEKSKND